MDRIDLTNETDEPITIKPGENITIYGEQSYYRSMAKRIKTFVIMQKGKR